MPVVEIPGVGKVRFPDDMPPEVIAREAKRLHDEHQARLPAAPDQLPVPGPGPVLDAASGLGEHLGRSALTLGEGLRSLPPGVGPNVGGVPLTADPYRRMGETIARLFGSPSPVPEEQGSFTERAQASRALVPEAPDTAAADIGRAGGYGVEAALSLPLGGPTGRGFAAVAQAMAREAGIGAATNVLQTGRVGDDALAAGAISGAMPGVGRLASKLRSGAKTHLAEGLLPPTEESVSKGASAARGLEDSGVMAAGRQSLYKKLDAVVERNSADTERFLRSDPKAMKATFSRADVGQVIMEGLSEIDNSEVLETSVKNAAYKRLGGLFDQFMGVNKPGRAQTLTAVEMLELRRKIDSTISKFERGTTSNAGQVTQGVRQSMRTRINELLKAKIPEIERFNQRDMDAIVARNTAGKLLNQGGSAQEAYLLRRGIPIAAGTALGGPAGGGAVAAGLAAGSGLQSPALVTPLVQAMKSRDGMRMAEILARLLAPIPQRNDEQEYR